MINDRLIYQCCGCGACSEICPHSAISMRPDVLGFMYPTVDKDACVNCGLCDMVCSFSPQYKIYENFEKSQVYAFRLSSVEDLQQSQSGGAFYAAANSFISNGGVVYGASFDDNLNVIHKRAVLVEELQPLRLSKYVQSNITDSFDLIKRDLQNGTMVLFSGTPCQVAALRRLIPRKLSSKLYTIDIVCHGAPSPAIWKDYVSFIEGQHNAKVVSAKFRDKQFGWSKNQTQSFLLSDGRVVYGKTSNNLYFGLYSIRDCCAHCPFTNVDRVGDMTVGDYWGWEKINELKERFDDDKGISLVMINSEKGKFLINSISDDSVLIQTDSDNYRQARLKTPTELNHKRSQFILDYKKSGFAYVAKKYGDLGWRWYVKQIKSHVVSTIRSIIK